LGNSESGKLRFKKNDDAHHFGNHGFKRVINNLSVRSLTSLKSELQMATRLHLHFRTTTEIIDGYSIEYCIVFYLNFVDYLNGDLGGQRDLKNSISGISGETETIDFANEEYSLDESMFIGTIKVTKKRQSLIPCLIRLQPLDACLLVVSQTNPITSNALGFSRSDVPWAIPYEATFTIIDGEVDSLVKCGMSANPELPEQMVKCRTQVVADISDNKRNIVRNIFKLLKPEHMLSLIAINFNIIDNLVWVTFKKPLNQVINSLEMVSCSSEFEKTAIKRMHMLKYPYGEESGQETKDSKGARDTRALKKRVPRQPKEGSQVKTSQPEEVEPQTFSDPHSGDYTAKNTHSGSPEDV